MLTLEFVAVLRDFTYRTAHAVIDPAFSSGNMPRFLITAFPISQIPQQILRLLCAISGRFFVLHVGDTHLLSVHLALALARHALDEALQHNRECLDLRIKRVHFRFDTFGNRPARTRQVFL